MNANGMSRNEQILAAEKIWRMESELRTMSLVASTGICENAEILLVVIMLKAVSMSRVG